MPIKLKPLRNYGPVKASFLRRKNKMVHRGALMPAKLCNKGLGVVGFCVVLLETGPPGAEARLLLFRPQLLPLLGCA